MTSHARSRLSRVRRNRRRGRQMRPDGAPTPQTAAKLRPDPLWTLLQSGRYNKNRSMRRMTFGTGSKLRNESDD